MLVLSACDARRASCKSECKNRGGKLRLLNLGISFEAWKETWYPLLRIYTRKSILLFLFFLFCTIGNVSYKQTFTPTTCVRDILSPHIALKSLNWPHVSSVLSWLWKLWRDFQSVLLHWYVTLSVSQESLLSSLYTYAHASQMVLDLGAIQSSALERLGYVSYFRSQEELPFPLFW